MYDMIMSMGNMGIDGKELQIGMSGPEPISRRERGSRSSESVHA